MVQQRGRGDAGGRTFLAVPGLGARAVDGPHPMCEVTFSKVPTRAIQGCTRRTNSLMQSRPVVSSCRVLLAFMRPYLSK